MNFRKLEEDLIRDEGLRLTVYRCPAGLKTIGVGHQLTDFDLDIKSCSLETAGMYLSKDIAVAIEGTIRIFGRDIWDSMSERRQHALINMMFNLGESGFRGFVKMIAAVKAGIWHRAGDEAISSLWYHQTGGARAGRIVMALLEG